MRTARRSMLALILMLSFAIHPRSAAAQLMPDWPTGGTGCRPADPGEPTVVAATLTTASSMPLFVRFHTFALGRGWFVRASRKPVGQMSTVAFRRRAAH